ncbi:MAG: hypothetical protein JWQ49_3640, partial [Edaphobacter sp.]|nr:hypothetical protein [Edaphobacter sp.]
FPQTSTGFHRCTHTVYRNGYRQTSLKTIVPRCRMDSPEHDDPRSTRAAVPDKFLLYIHDSPTGTEKTGDREPSCSFVRIVNRSRGEWKSLRPRAHPSSSKREPRLVSCAVDTSGAQISSALPNTSVYTVRPESPHPPRGANAAKKPLGPRE